MCKFYYGDTEIGNSMGKIDMYERLECEIDPRIYSVGDIGS